MTDEAPDQGFEFPRPLVKIGECYALAKVLNYKGTPSGTPLMRRIWMMHEGERWAASRLSYNLNVAPIPCNPPSLKQGLVLHSCDNDWCVHPNHLRIGTQMENMEDRRQRNKEYKNKLSASHSGRKLSQKTRERISASLRDNPPMLGMTGEKNPFFGQKHTQETKEKMRAAWERRRANGKG